VVLLAVGDCVGMVVLLATGAAVSVWVGDGTDGACFALGEGETVGFVVTTSVAVDGDCAVETAGDDEEHPPVPQTPPITAMTVSHAQEHKQWLPPADKCFGSGLLAAAAVTIGGIQQVFLLYFCRGWT
jgi:hypothetical protein